jgi:hypothetical protein
MDGYMKNNCLGNALWFCFASLLLVYLSGCGQILGVREIDAWGLKMQFTEGLDFGFGVNGVDNVNNQRGINPLPKAPSAIQSR